MMNVYIQDAVRTPRGKGREGGGLASLTPYALVDHLVGALERRNPFTRTDAERLTLGCVGQVDDQGGHIAMTSKIYARLDPSCPAHTINNFCASGLSAIGIGLGAIQSGQAKTALAGGVEMLSRVPFMADRSSYYTATDFDAELRYVPVALAADRLAFSENISRQTMDAIALRSQQRAEATDQDKGLQRSRISVGGLNRDEAIRPTTAEKLAAMKPAFAPLAETYAAALNGADIEHRMTKSHAPPMTDGSALAIIGADGVFEAPRARIVAFAEAGGDARQSLLAGIAAMRSVLDRSGMTLADMDRIEFMEAFAPPVAIFERDFKPDLSKVNVTGGHIAKGHPMGATGAVLLSTLMDVLDVADGQFGLVVVTGAQGAGAAMIIERLR